MTHNTPDANGNGITVKKSQISFWATFIIGAITVYGAWFGASRPSQPESSANNQTQILANQAFVMQQVSKIDQLEANQKAILQKLDGLERKQRP